MIAVVLRSRDPARLAEALRAAVGLTLRGDTVVLVPLVPLPAGDRAVEMLRAMGHVVDGTLADVRRARAVEVWT